MAQLLTPGSILAMTDQAADRLIKLDSGDAALLYLHLLRRGSPEGLRWPEERKRAALKQLQDQGLASLSLTAAPAEPEASNSPDLSLSLSQLIFGLWLLGAAVVLIWNLLSHLRFCRYLNRWAAPVRDADILALYNALGDQLGLDRRPRLLSCPGLAVPMLAGLFRPSLLLPENPPAGDALRFSLLHELTHFRRRDIFRKTLALWVRTLHWFNPLVWLTARTMDRDIELSCDESALKHLPPAEHAAYGRTILSAVSALTGAGRSQSGSISDSEF